METGVPSGLAIVSLACIVLASGCGAGAVGPTDAGGACAPVDRSYRLPAAQDIDVLVVVDATPSLAGEEANVREDLRGLVGNVAGMGRGYYEHVRLAFTTTARTDGTLVAAAGNPTIIDGSKVGRVSFASLASANLEAAFGDGSGHEGMVAVESAVEHSGIRRAGDLLQVDVFTDRDDASPAPPASYASALVHLSPGLRFAVAGSVVSGTPAICTDTTCESACTSPDPTSPPCNCGGADPSARWVELAGAMPVGYVASICSPVLAEADLSGPQSVILSTRPAGDDPAHVRISITHPNGITSLCASPTSGQTCADGVDWAYRASPPTALLCGQPGSGCFLEAGASYTIRIDPCP